MRLLCVLALAACGASEFEVDSGGYGSPSADAGAGGTVGCLSSNECPASYVCNDFGQCVMPVPMGDGGVVPPPEIEYDLGSPISSQRFV